MNRRETKKFKTIHDSITMNNLKKIMDANDYSINKVATDIDIAESTLYNYLTNNRIPSLSTLIELSDFFNTSIEYLIDKTTNPISINSLETLSDNEELNQLLHTIISLPEDKQKIVLGFVQGLLK